MNTREMSDRVTEKVQDWQRRATDTAKSVSETTDRYVRENTWTTIACAAVLGCIVGFLLSSRGD